MEKEVQPMAERKRNWKLPGWFRKNRTMGKIFRGVKVKKK